MRLRISPYSQNGRLVLESVIEAMLERFASERFGQNGGESAIEIVGLLFRHDTGGHGDDGNRGGRGIVAQDLGRLNAVHYRHLHVHEDQIPFFVARTIHGFLPVFDRDGFVAEESDHLFEDHVIYPVIIRDENAS